MKRPLLLVLMGLVLGEITAYLLGQIGFLMPASLLAVLLLDQGTSQKLKPFFIPFLCFLGAFGFGLVSWNMEQKRAEQAACLVHRWSGKVNEITGQVTDRKDTVSGYVTYTIRNPEIYQEGSKTRILLSGRIQVTGEQCPDQEFVPGDRIQVSSVLESLEMVRNPGEFNTRNYCLSQGIFLTGFFEEAGLERRPGLSFRRVAYQMKQNMEYSFLTYMNPEDSAMICAMAFGDKSYLSEEEKKLYEENGVAHLLAISGLHVSIVGGRIYRTLRKKGCSYGISCLGGAGLVFFYGCMTGMGSSVLRAFLMYLVYLGSEWMGGDYDLVSSMSLSGIFMLLEHPYRLLEGGFQISYTCVLTIGGILPYFIEEKEKEERGNGLERWKSQWKKTLTSSAVIYAVTVPLLLYHFYEMTPYSIFLNPLVLPWMSPLMLDALLGGLLSIPLAVTASLPAFPLGGSFYRIFWEIMSLPAIGIIRGYHGILSLARKLPGALLITGCPPLWALGVIYFAEFAVAYCYKKGWKKGILALCVGISFLFAGTYHKRLRITMLDVGQGECILLQLPGGRNLLVDGGSISQKDLYKKVMEPAFRYCGVTRLDYVLITHMDEDHISGIEEMLEAGFPVRHLVTGRVKERGSDPIMEEARKVGIDVIFLEKGDRLHFGKLDLTCLHPTYKVYDNANDQSLVLALHFQDFQGLFTGDLGMEEEANLSLSDQKMTLLKIAHHGSKYSTSEEFLSKIMPEYAILSAGAKNHYGHPHEELLERVGKTGARIYQTLEGGAILVESDGRKNHVRYFASEPPGRKFPFVK